MVNAANYAFPLIHQIKDKMMTLLKKNPAAQAAGADPS